MTLLLAGNQEAWVLKEKLASLFSLQWSYVCGPATTHVLGLKQANDWKSIFMLKVIHVAEYRNISNVNTSNQTPDVCNLLRKIVIEVDSCHKTGQEDIWWKPTHIFANKFPCIYHVSAWMGLLSWGFFLNNSIFLCQNGWDFCLNSKILAKFYQQQKTISDVDRDW